MLRLNRILSFVCCAITVLNVVATIVLGVATMEGVEARQFIFIYEPIIVLVLAFILVAGWLTQVNGQSKYRFIRINHPSRLSKKNRDTEATLPTDYEGFRFLSFSIMVWLISVWPLVWVATGHKDNDTTLEIGTIVAVLVIIAEHALFEHVIKRRNRQ